MSLMLTSFFFLVVGKNCFHPNSPPPGILESLSSSSHPIETLQKAIAMLQEVMIPKSHRSCFRPKRKRSRLTCGVAIMHACTHTQTHVHMHKHIYAVHIRTQYKLTFLHMPLHFFISFIFQVQWYTLDHMNSVVNHKLTVFVVIVNLTQTRVFRKEREFQLRKRFYQIGL